MNDRKGSGTLDIIIVLVLAFVNQSSSSLQYYHSCVVAERERRGLGAEEKEENAGE